MSFKANQHVLIRLPSQNIKFVQLVPDTIISLGKFGSFRADDIIGDPYGFTYAIGDEMKLDIVEDPNNFEDGQAEQSMSGDKIEADGLQSLTAEEIEELKQNKSISGQDIIDMVTKNHSSFQHKSEFSKDKYLKRKRQKFLQQFTPQPIESTELLEYYQDKDPQKVMNMSLEALALMLNLANVKPGGHYLVLDETTGVLTQAVLERLGKSGSVTVLHEAEHPNLSCMKFVEPSPAKLTTINLQELLYPQEIPVITERTEEELKKLSSNQRSQHFKAVRRQKDREEVLSIANGDGFDGLLVTTSLQLTSLIPRLIPYISGSAPMVIYHQYKEHLVELTLDLKKQTEFLAPTILETRVRRYQTIPGRIHPLMTSKNYGGYVLSGTRVLPDPSAQARGYYGKKKKVEAA